MIKKQLEAENKQLQVQRDNLLAACKALLKIVEDQNELEDLCIYCYAPTESLVILHKEYCRVLLAQAAIAEVEGVNDE